jgi:hypothetical protein
MATATTSADCPRESASGTFTEEFGTNNAGATAAAKWLREKRAWINDTFTDLCAHDTDCPKTQIVIKATSAINPLTKKMSYTITFRVICYCTTEITPPRKKRGG